MLIYYPSNKDNANTFFGDDMIIYDYTLMRMVLKII